MSTAKFSDDFKRDAVHQIVERGYPVAEVSKRLGVSSHSLYAWKKRFWKSGSRDVSVDERVLRATQVIIEECIARPILIGRPAMIEQRIARFGLTLDPSRDFEIINPEDDPRYRDYVALFHSLVGRSGVTPETARSVVRTNTTVIGALAVKLREADPDLVVEGEMQGDAALNQNLREQYVPDTILKGEANLLIFPNLDAASLAMTLLKEVNDALSIGPILMGPNSPAHILAPSSTSRGIVNMTAIAANGVLLNQVADLAAS